MLLIFDGPDKVGKTTLIHEVDKATNYQHIMIDRGPTSYIVYDKLLNRECLDRKFEYLRDLKDLEKINHLCIYLEATDEDVEKRLQAVGEKPVNGIPHVEFDTEFNIELFERKHRCTNIIVINTSDFSIEENVKTILRNINDILKHNYCNGYVGDNYYLFKLKLKEDNSKDMTGIAHEGKKYIEYYPSYNSYSLEMLELYDITFDETIDKPYYDMLYNSLNHMLHKKEIGWINKRQMVYTSNDCIPFIQLIPIIDDEYDLLVCQRSLDIKKHGYNDLAFFMKWIKDNNLKVNTIHYNISVPHAYL
jgi:thymidylate kinase